MGHETILRALKQEFEALSSTKHELVSSLTNIETTIVNIDKKIKALETLFQAYKDPSDKTAPKSFSELDIKPVTAQDSENNDELISFRVTTPARDAVMKREYPIGTPNSEILAMLNALPGKAFDDEKSVSSYAGRLRIKRPDWFIEKHKLSVINRPAKAVQAPKKPEQPPLRTKARDEILYKEWPAGTERDVIAEKMNALPGMFVTEQRVSSYAARIGLKRPDWYILQKRSQSGLIAATLRKERYEAL